MSDLISGQSALTKRTVHERLIIAKTLVESVLDDLSSAQPGTQLIAEIKVSKEDMEELLAEKVEARGETK